MNITFLLRLWPIYGGGETVTIVLANEMVRRGHNVSLLYFKENVRNLNIEISSKIKTYRIDGVDCDEFHTNEDDAQTANEYLKRFIADHHIDVVINQWWNPSYIQGINSNTNVVVVKCLHQAFLAVSLHGSKLLRLAKRCLLPLYVVREKRKSIRYVMSHLPSVDKFIFLSPRFQRQFEDLANYKDNDHKLGAIANPLVYSCDTPTEDFNSKQNVVLVVARMEETQKRISSIIKAWSIVEKEYHVNNWKLQIVGEGRDLEHYKRMAINLDLQYISFEGYQDPRPYYKQAKIFLMSSFFEGFSMTLVECSQFGVVPIVMDSFLSLHDIIEDGKNGLITPNEDVNAFASSIRRLMNDPSLWKELSLNAIEMCKRFRVENIVDQWELLFHKALEEKKINK